jgi:hypothetical protein
MAPAIVAVPISLPKARVVVVKELATKIPEIDNF